MMLWRGCKSRSTAMSNKSNSTVATMGIDIGKNSFHVVGLDQRGAIVLRQKWSRGQVEARLANMPPCLIGMEACVGAAACVVGVVVGWGVRSLDGPEIFYVVLL
jgi:transposase